VYLPGPMTDKIWTPNRIGKQVSKYHAFAERINNVTNALK